MNIEDSPSEKLNFISEKSSNRSVRIRFVPGTQFTDFEKRIPKIIEYALAKREKDKRKIYLDFTCCFEDKWELICKTLAQYIDQLPKIDVLDVQHSDFPLAALNQLYLIYSKCENMENLPIIIIDDTFAHEEADRIFIQCRIEQKGKDFLEKLCFPENKWFVTPPNYEN